MPAKVTKTMPSGGFVRCYSYSQEDAQNVISILKADLLPEWDASAQHQMIIEQTGKAVGFLWQSQLPDWEEPAEILSKAELAKIHAAYGKYANLVQAINFESLEKLEILMMEKGLGKSSAYEIRQKIRNVLGENDELLRLLDLLRTEKKNHRPQDQIRRHTVYHLYLIHRRVTGKAPVASGTLKKYIEAAIYPLVLTHKRFVTQYLKEIKKDYGEKSV